MRARWEGPRRAFCMGMGKLKSLGSGLRTLPPAVRWPSREERERDWSRQRDDTVEWRGWYKTARWRALRRKVLIRDGYQCQQTGVMLTGRHPEPNSPVVDHIVPHRGDPDLFWDENNLQAVSKAYHDSVKQAAEAADRGASKSSEPSAA